MTLHSRRTTLLVIFCLTLFGIALHLAFAWLYAFPSVLMSEVRTSDPESLPNALLRNSSHWSGNATQRSIFVVKSAENFTNRIQSLNDLLDSVRRSTWSQLGGNASVWNVVSGRLTFDVVSGKTDRHIELLALNYNHIVSTVVLPWLPPSSSSGSVWNSLDDTVNVGIQRYYQWTGDDKLCDWIESGNASKKQIDIPHNFKCERNITQSTDQPVAFQPEVDGDLQEPHHMNEDITHPAHVFYVHVLREAVVTKNGEVISGTLKLVLPACYSDTRSSAPPAGEILRTQVYDEVYVISQFWGTNVFHRMTEIMPRLALATKFLRRNPKIRIHAPETTLDGRLADLMRIYGIDTSRLVAGLVRARVLYLPRSTRCGLANVAESQVAARKYAEHVTNEWPHVARSTPNRLILIKRTGTRRFTAQVPIERALKRTAVDFNLTYTLFDERSLPTLNVTMQWFNTAVMIVGPHGAGLSNIYFSRPGTYVVEGLCNPPHVNWCFQRLAFILGLRWHGLMTRGGCVKAMSLTPVQIDTAVRTLLTARGAS